MLKSGVFLGKRYEILERIGSGGMADVYKGRDHKLNRLVASKVLKSDYRSDGVFVSKFVSEARAAAGLMHPNVVNVYDVGQDRGLYFMVMELVDGITLKDYIEKKRRISAKETISIAIQMVTGMEAAHKHHIIHRDIKPQNIIISKDGKVKVTDFGIARATTSSNTISANVMGSVHYTSPEQARGGVTDEKSDIYSVGITLYEMVTGHVPFDGDSTVSIAIKQLQEELPLPSREVRDIPYALEQIIIKCTQKSPENRYQNAQELLRDLKRALVEPNGDFVRISSAAAAAGRDTVLFTDDDMERLYRKPNRRDQYDEYDDYDDDEYDDDYDDGYDDDDYGDDEYDDDEYEGRGRRRGKDQEDEDVNPKMAKVMKILMIVVAVIIALVAVILIGKAAGLFKVGPSSNAETTEDSVEVPHVVGMTEKEAIAALNKKGLGYTIKSRKESDKYEKGYVMSQSPKDGEKVDKNTQIELVISSGKTEEEIEVPDVKDRDEAKAQKMLEDAGFVVDSEAGYSDDVDEGKVISTNPEAGSKAKKGSVVTMKVSMGEEKVEVPNLQNMTAEQAEAELSARGLSSGNVTEKNSDSVAQGKVISQGTKAGKKVSKGTSVDYVISLGPKTKLVVVPTLTGKYGDDAAVALQNAGLDIGVVDYAYSNTVSAGYVISQTATPGSQVEAGTKVGYTISKGPEAPADSGN